jgi:PKD repeat protein
VTFTSTSINGSSFSWKFGDGATGSGATTSHTYHAPGNYLVTLTITDHCKTDSFRNYVSVIMAPTGITPADQSAVKIYPNPSSTVIHIDLGDMDIKDAVITLANAFGQTVRRTAPSAALSSISVSDLPAGAYTLSVSGHSYPVLIQR